MDGLLLGFIARELAEKLTGARVDRVLQPEKDELHLVLRAREGTHRLLLSASATNARAHLTYEAKQNPAEPPMFCMLLRRLLGGGRVVGIRQIDGDRILEITFDCADEMGERVSYVLICEIMGRHSNIILMGAQGRITDAIRHVGVDVSRVREVKPGIPYMRPPAQDKLDPSKADAYALSQVLIKAAPRLDRALSDTLSGIGSQSAKELSFRLTGDEAPYLDEATRIKLGVPLEKLLQKLPSLGPPVLLLDEGGEVTGLFPFPQAMLSVACQREVPEGASFAMDAFYRLRDHRERLRQKSSALTKSLHTHIERCEKKLALYEETLADEARVEEARLCGELLTANMHLIGKTIPQSIEVNDYYTGGTRQIMLDTRLSPARNAQKYYKQYQKMRAAQRHAGEQAEQTRAELSALESWLDDLRKCEEATELDEIRAELERGGYLRASHNRGKAKKPSPSTPLVCTSSDGLRILVGKNSAQNDRITAQAHPEALWLHAKNMAGSHVVVECAGDVPEATLREAALLASWYSRGYRSAQMPIDYTLRKHVKKPSGAASGLVTYTNQRTLYITPDEQQVKRLIGERQ